MMKQGICAWRATALALAIGLGAAGSATAQVKAALVRDVDRSEAQPVNGSCSGFSAGSNNFVKCQLFTVPAGKRLVVETLSYQLYTDSSSSVVQLLVGKDDPGFANMLFGTGVYAVSPATPYVGSSYKSYNGVQPIRFYMNAGDILSGMIYYTGGLNYSQSFSFSGFLVDL